MESLIRESDLRRMVIKMREKETCMETVTAAYVSTDEDFRLKAMPERLALIRTLLHRISGKMY